MVSVHLTGRHPDRLPVRAEQFFTWRLLSGITPGLALLQEIAAPKTDAVLAAAPAAGVAPTQLHVEHFFC